jgi:hypothetical protein
MTAGRHKDDHPFFHANVELIGRANACLCQDWFGNYDAFGIAHLAKRGFHVFRPVPTPRVGKL